VSPVARAGLALACVVGLLTTEWWISRSLEAGLQREEGPASDQRPGG
jgi:hypothetical protein